MNYFMAFFLIGLAILVHESGHFIAARLMKIPVKVFSIGFGPKLLVINSKTTQYRISLIPIGGYVLPAMEGEAEFFNIPVYKRLVMSLGGPVASSVLPLLGLMFLNFLVAGFSFTTLLIKPFMQLSSLTSQLIIVVPRLFIEPNQLSGPVGIVAAGGKFIGADILNSLKFLCLISLNLAILNLLPIPALDGGKILLYLLELIHPKFVRLHLPLSIAGWVLILILTLVVTIGDISKLMGLRV